ncbi:MAG: EF-Tu/IF-2/RF-3 family GTPase, partial [Thermoplasmata archaeon]
MSGISVAVVGALEVAPQLGKKGTQSDLTLYNATREGHHATIIEPTHFPEKFPPLLTALQMADRALLVVNELSKSVAETIAAVDLHDVPTLLVMGPSVGTDELSRVLKGGRLENAPRMKLDLPRLRELVDEWSVPDDSEPVQVPLDHSFPVKGVGVVALGVVRHGTLRAHEELRLWPSEKIVEARSLQVHDVDVKEARTGDRVGVALKGVDVDELSRGQILAGPTTLRAGT